MDQSSEPSFLHHHFFANSTVPTHSHSSIGLLGGDLRGSAIFRYVRAHLHRVSPENGGRCLMIWHGKERAERAIVEWLEEEASEEGEANVWHWLANADMRYVPNSTHLAALFSSIHLSPCFSSEAPLLSSSLLTRAPSLVVICGLLGSVEADHGVSMNADAIARLVATIIDSVKFMGRHHPHGCELVFVEPHQVPYPNLPILSSSSFWAKIAAGASDTSFVRQIVTESSIQPDAIIRYWASWWVEVEAEREGTGPVYTMSLRTPPSSPTPAEQVRFKLERVEKQNRFSALDELGSPAARVLLLDSVINR
ncbi:uncharacterized protein VTP21DRAFT_11015 [Calcarisporiella thermophila]|uniref:uncharacterized protein n=1 Tax=Calcarisporiella thermophila TaxID=911321 RepID=UPI0037442FFE